MQEKYPGNYRLGYKYDINSGLLYLIPKFEDPKEETCWKLKYSYEQYKPNFFNSSLVRLFFARFARNEII